MFKRVVLVAAILCLAGLGIAQTVQTGNIMGTVTSREGEGLGGATVTLTSPALIVAKKTAITNAAGAYRFLALPPGFYELTFELSGMNTVVRKEVQVMVTQTSAVNVTMEPKSVQESIVVVGQVPTVDKQHVSRPVNMDKEFLKSIPATRTLANFFNMAPGVSDGSAQGGSTMDNTWLLDGVNLVDMATGTQAVNFGLDVMEELAVQTGGLPAEYGSVRAGVVNVVSKSGGNKFSGTASIYFNHEKLKADNTQGTPLAGSKSGNKIQYEPIVTLGGPIFKDKLWFFMNGSFDRTEAFVAGYPGNCPPGQEKPFVTWLPYPFLKFTFQPGRNDKFTVSYNYSDRITDDRGASKFAFESVTQKQTSPAHILNVQWTKFFGSNFFANLKYGMVLYQLLLTGKGPDAQVNESNTGMSWGNSWRNHDWYGRNRFQGNADATAFIDNLAGTHELKFGGEVQYFHSTWDVYCVDDPTVGGCYITLIGGKYYSTLVQKGNGFKRIDEMLDFAGFVQDNWSITRNLNLNLGLRVEYNSIVYPAQNTTEGPLTFLGKTYNRSIPESLTMYKWVNLAPRLGLVYDLFSDGKTLFKASWSRYIIANQQGFINLSHPNGWFGYTQYLNPDGTPIPGSVALWAMPGGFQNRGAVVGYTAADGTKYDCNAGYTDELTITLEREIIQDWSIAARYIRKWDRNQPNMVDAAQLDIDELLKNGNIVWTNWTSKTVTDPYNGQTLTYYQRIDMTAQKLYFVNPPGLNRDYNGFELTINKRLSKGFALNISYVYAKSTGLLNTTRGDESLGGAVAGFFQSPNAHTNALGTLSLERRHQLKIEGLFKGPFGINFSGYFRYLSGLPFTRQASNNYLGLSLKQNITIYAETRGAENLPDTVQLDLRLEKTFRISIFNLGVFADCFNVFNRGVATGIWTNSSNTGTYKFKQMTSINDPRIFQLGARIEF